MSEIKNDRYIIRYISHEHNVKLDCPSNCFYILNKEYECKHRKELTIKSSNDIKINTVKIIIKNVFSETIDFRISDFELVDNFGFSINATSFCDSYFIDKRILTCSSSIPPNTQKYVMLVFQELDKECYIEKLLSFNRSTNKYQEISIDNKINDNDLSLYICAIDLLKQEISSLKNENECLRNSNLNNNSSENRINNQIKYKIEEDDDFLYIISDEKDQTVSFNREFDKSVDNYNWVDKDTPLITMRLDNVFAYENCPTKISSPCSGIFEYNSNKLISYNSQICRIRKYPQENKTQILLEKEREKIKENIYKKERKKAIEREALDELINEGLVFNSYIDKQGNRSKIPYDIANAVWNRDGGKCVYCGSCENLEFDHIIPISRGGATSYRNLQLLCEKCNRTKSDKI